MSLLKVGIEKLAPSLLVFSFYPFALVTTLCVLIFTRTPLKWSDIFNDKKLLIIVAFAGISIGLVDYFFSKGLSAESVPNLAIYAPLFTVIGLSLTAIIGVVIFHETLTPLRLTGFVLSCIGIFLLAR